MKKIVLKLEYADEKIRRKAMKNISGISGMESMSVDFKEKKLTVLGDVDPVTAVAKLRKLCNTELVSVETVKEPEAKLVEPPKKIAAPKLPEYHALPYYYQSNHYRPAPAYYAQSVEDDAKGCVIC